MTKFFSETPSPPYYIVAFSSRRTEGDNGDAEMAEAMEELTFQQPGCLGAESARGADGFGITNSFWKDEANMKAWKANVDHKLAQKLGREIFIPIMSSALRKWNVTTALKKQTCKID